jgi:hypothetical protein
MDRGESGTGGRVALRLLAGLQAGVLGGVAMLAWAVATSAWRQQPWWAFPNLMASGLFGESVFHLGFGRASWSGIALLLFLTGTLGSVFALLVPESVGSFRFVLLAFAASLAWYYATASPALNHWAPLVPLYTPKPILYTGHLIYGLCLALERHHYRKMLGAFSEGSGPS